MVGPAVLRRVAEDSARALDRQERLAALDLAGQRDVGEDLGHQVRAGAGHHGVVGGDDADLGSGHVRGQPEPAGLGDVPAVDVAPQVPLAQRGVVPERGEPGVVVGLHDVRDPQGHDRDPGSPVELGRERLAGELREGVARLRSRLDGLVDRRELRRRVEREAEHGLARRPDDALEPVGLGRGEHVVRRQDVVAERVGRRADARGGDRGEVDDGVVAARASAVWP